jgi:hypothetical protein
MAGYPSPTPEQNPAQRARLIVGALIGVPLLVMLIVVAIIATSNAPTPTPTPPPPPSGSIEPGDPETAVIAPRCQTVPVDAVYAFGTFPLPAGSRSIGNTTASQGAAFVAERFTVSWPEGGFTGWAERDLGIWRLAGDVFRTEQKQDAAGFLRRGEDTANGQAFLVAEDATTLRVEMPARLVAAEEPVVPLAPVAIAKGGEGDACAFLSAYVLLDGSDGTSILAETLAGFVATPVGGGAEIRHNASNAALRPVRLPDGGYRIPLESGVTYRIAYPVNGQSYPVYDRRAFAASGICDPVIIVAPEAITSASERSVLRIDAREIEIAKGLCAGGLFVETESYAIRTPTREEAFVPELNGLAMAVRIGQALSYRPDLIAALEAKEQATAAAGLLVSILFYAGVAGGIATAGFAIYIGFVMDRGPRRRAPGRGLARPVEPKGRR